MDFGPEATVTGQVHTAMQLLLPGTRDSLTMATSGSPGSTGEDLLSLGTGMAERIVWVQNCSI